jgi:hypothetical protein
VAKYFAAKNRRERAEREKVKSGFDFGKRGDLARAFADLRVMPETTVEEIAAKAARLTALTEDGAAAWTLARACDLYVAAFLLPKVRNAPFAGPDGLPRRGKETVPTTGAVSELLRGVRPFGLMMGAAAEAAGSARAFHWPLEFPDVMAKGGFDVVIGNPPWERIKLQEQEFFAARNPQIAGAPNKAAREKLIKAIAAAPEGSSNHALYDAFIAAKREAEATSEFVRVPGTDGGRFPLTGRGDVNTYALFAEHFARLPAQIGRAGIIVPTGIATDATTAPFFASLVQDKRLVAFVSFENEEMVFSSVHHAFKFALMTIAADIPLARFAFFLRQVAAIGDPERNFNLSPKQIALLNPNTLTAPVFRSRADAELTAKIYANTPVIMEVGKGEAGNPWGVSFTTMFHMSNDSGLFRTVAQLQSAGFRRHGTDWAKGKERYVPLYEAKMIHQFDHRWASYTDNGEDSADVSLADKQNAGFEPAPRYWVPKEQVDVRLLALGWHRKWLLGLRGITNATNERTIVAGIWPLCGAGNSVHVWGVPDTRSPQQVVLLYGALCSLTLDFVARQKIGGTNLNFFYVQQFPIPPPSFFTKPRAAFVVPRILELTYTSHALTSFARDLGHDGSPFRWDEERRAHLRAELDVFYARAYRLTRDELRYILDPADVNGPDYPSETFRVLKEKEIRQHGEYRTARLVLAAWDGMEADGSFKRMDL